MAYSSVTSLIRLKDITFFIRNEDFYQASVPLYLLVSGRSEEMISVLNVNAQKMRMLKYDTPVRIVTGIPIETQIKVIPFIA